MAIGQDRYNTIYSFGDSYADTNEPPGGVFNLSPLAPCDQTRYPDCRFSDGGNFVDRLQQNFGITNALNYAYGGAQTSDQNVASVPPFLVFPGFEQQYEPFGATPNAFNSQGIIALSIGGNNASAILAGDVSVDPTDPATSGAAFARVSAGELRTGVQTLVDAGAQTITYFSVGAPGLYPDRGADPNSDAGIAATAFLNTFLIESQQELAAIAAQGVRVNVFNFAELQRRIFLGGEAERFGFSAAAAGIPTAAEVPCPDGSDCTNVDPTGFFYWDEVHLTEAAYNLAADFMTIQLVQNETIPVQTELAEIQARNFSDTLHQRMLARRNGATGFEVGYSARDAADPGRLSWKDEPAPHPEDAFALFVAGGYAAGERAPRDGIVGYDYDLRHIVVGGEWKATEHTYLGGAIGYSNAAADYDFLRGFGDTDLESINIGAYASLAYPDWFADLALAYSVNSYDLNRTGIVSPYGVGIPLDVDGETEGDSFVADFRTGYLFRSGAFAIGPIAGLSYAHVTVDGYTETGDTLLTLTIDDQTVESLIGSVGVQLRYKQGGIEPYLAVTLEQELLDDGRSYDFALTSAAPVVNGVTVGADDEPFGRVRAGLKAELSDGLIGSIDGNATFGRDSGDDYAVSGALKFRF